MLRLPFVIACLFLCAVSYGVDITPDHDITLDQIGYMLKAGFPSETIIKGIVAGRVYGTFDAERENEFKHLNASPALIELLKSGNYAGTEEQQRAEKKQRDRQEELKEPPHVAVERQRLAKEAEEWQRQQAAEHPQQAQRNSEIVVAPVSEGITFKLPSEIEAEKRAARVAQIAARKKYCEEHPVECEMQAAAEQARASAQRTQMELESLKTRLWMQGIDR